MSENRLEKELIRLTTCTHPDKKITYSLEYVQLKDNVEIIIKYCGTEGLVQASSKIAVISFYRFPNIRFIVKHDKPYVKKDFELLKMKLDISCPVKEHYKSTSSRFIDDIKANFKYILIEVIIFILLYLPIINSDIEALIALSGLLIDIAIMMIGTILVFIGFFYSDVNKNLILYKEGKFDKEINIDKYVLKITMFAIISSVVAKAISDFKCTNVVIKRFFLNYLEYNHYLAIKHWIVFICVFISMICLTICFEAIFNYYLNKIRNRFFMDSFEMRIEANKKNRMK